MFARSIPIKDTVDVESGFGDSGLTAELDSVVRRISLNIAQSEHGRCTVSPLYLLKCIRLRHLHLKK